MTFGDPGIFPFWSMNALRNKPFHAWLLFSPKVSFSSERIIFPRLIYTVIIYKVF